MKIAIDATNIKAGGGLTHLKRIIENYTREDISIIVIGGPWLESIEDSENLQKIIFPHYFKSLFKQEYFKKFLLRKYLSKGDIAFTPGGTFSNSQVSYISMSQNMLVFENKERNRFPRSLTWLRYILLERLQLKSFRNSRGIIYISEYAKRYIENKYPDLKSKQSTVIYHGISDDFRQQPKPQLPISRYSADKPFRILYTSIVNYYKHQWNVIDAVKMLKNEGYNISLDLVGGIYKPLSKKLETCLQGTEEFVQYKGKVPYAEISNTYKRSNMFIFASTCENMPNILVEAMSSGLPILCSNYGPMPEVLRDAGTYMDPTDVNSIYAELKKLINDVSLREQLAQKAYNYSLEFSWERTAQQTFDFIKRSNNK